ncbi:hypothetical protein JMUB7547_28580 [Staphylococcus aureus]
MYKRQICASVKSDSKVVKFSKPLHLDLAVSYTHLTLPTKLEV